MNDSFTLYDLQVSTVGDPKSFVCGHIAGPNFTVVGENLIFNSTDRFSQYALATLMPLLPVKQRVTQPTDWITTDELIACADPNCGARFKIERIGSTVFHHGDVTKTSLPASRG